MKPIYDASISDYRDWQSTSDAGFVWPTPRVGSALFLLPAGGYGCVRCRDNGVPIADNGHWTELGTCDTCYTTPDELDQELLFIEM